MSIFRRKRTTSPDQVIAGATSTSDLAQRRYRVPNADLAKLWDISIGYASIWASMNARAVASQELKLVRRVKRTTTETRRVGKVWHSQVAAGKMGRKAAEFVNQGGDLEDVADHPILDLLNHPMPGVSGQAWIERLQYFKERTGNAFVNIIVDPETNQPVWLYHMQPHWTRIIPAEDGVDPVAGYLFGKTARDQQEFETDDVAHFTLRMGEDTHYGETWVEDVDTELEIIRANNAFQEEFIQRGMIPPFALKSETATETQRTEMGRFLEREYGGWRKWTKILLLTKWDVVPTNAKPSEFQTLEQLQEAKKEIRSAAGVPESMADKDSTNASAVTGYSGQYLGTTIAPRVERLADELSDQIIPLFSADPREFCFIAGDVVPQDRDFILRKAQTLIPLGLPLNRALEEMGEEGIGPEGDKSNVAAPAPGTDPAPNPFDAAIGGLFGRSAKCDHVHAPWDWKAVAWARSKDADLIARGRINSRIREIAASLEREVSGLYSGLPNTGDVPQSFTIDLEKILDPNLNELMQIGADMAFRELDGSAEFEIQPVLPEGFTVDLARAISDTTQDRLSDVIVRGAEQGMTTAEVQEQVSARIESLSGQAANTIARTETARAVESGRHAQWEELGVEAKTWLLAPNACPMCIGFNAKFGNKAVPLGEPFATAGTSFLGSDGKTYTLGRDVRTGGGVHPACVLPGTEVVAGSVIAAMRAMYSGPVVTIRTGRGRELTVTENHQILTRRGWVPAHAIREGDDLIGTACLNTGSGPDDDDGPAVVEEVFESARSAFGVSPVGVPVASEHLHGDGGSIDRQVEVVSPGGLLLGDGGITVAEHLCKNSLLVGHSNASDLTSDGGLDACFLALSGAASGSVGGLHLCHSLLRGHGSHSDVHRFAAIALNNPSLVESIENHAAVYAETLSQCLDTLAAFVATDHVVNVKTRDYRGHVYDLTTVSGVYVADGIVTHNCRCGTEAVLED